MQLVEQKLKYCTCLLTTITQNWSSSVFLFLLGIEVEFVKIKKQKSVFHAVADIKKKTKIG